jgi:hypothetical protein
MSGSAGPEGPTSVRMMVNFLDKIIFISVNKEIFPMNRE